MKKQTLSILAKGAEKMIKIAQDGRSGCTYWSFQPKVPQNIKSFKK